MIFPILFHRGNLDEIALMSHAPAAEGRAEVIAAIVATVTEHTGLAMPVSPHVLATALLLSDPVYALSETAAAVVVIDHVLRHIPLHHPELAPICAEPTEAFRAELTGALCVLP